MHLRRLTEKQRQREVYGVVVKQRVTETQVLLIRCFSDNGKGTPLSPTNGFERWQIVWIYRHHIALLRFVAPNFQGAHTLFITWDRANLEVAATAAIFYELRKGITQATRTYVVDEGNGVFITSLPASINDFLASTLNFRVLTLD